MAVVCNFYNKSCRWGEEHINAWVPAAPKDTIHAIVESFILSFSVSLIMSGGDLNKAVLGGGFAILATTIHVAGIASLPSFIHWGNKQFGKSLELDFEI